MYIVLGRAGLLPNEFSVKKGLYSAFYLGKGGSGG